MLLLKILLILCTQSSGMVCRTGKISFYSDAPLEKIEAHNRRVHITWDPQSGNAEFLVLMKAFEFKKALMQEHFNDNYVESHLYPKAVFKGVLNTSPVDLQTNQIIEVMARGNLTLHGVTRSVALPGTIIIQNGKVAMKAEFELTLSDFKIKIPAIVSRNISKQVRVTVSAADFNPVSS